MKYLALQAVSVLGDRVERGQVVEVRPEIAHSIGEHLLKPIDEESPVVEAEPVEEKPFTDMTRLELVEEAKKRKLPSTGSKAELLERLTLSIQ